MAAGGDGVKTAGRASILCAILCLFALLTNVPRVFVAPAAADSDLDNLLRQIQALEAAATAQGLKDSPGDMAVLQAPLEAARAMSKGSQVFEVREAAMKAAMATLDGLLKSKQQSIEKQATQRFATRQAYYAADHAALSNGVWNDLTQKIQDLATLLQSANALSFLVSSGDIDAKFQTFYPGYATAELAAPIFGQTYEKWMGDWENYTFGTLMANNKEAIDIKNNLLDLLSKLNDASDTLKAPVLGYRQLIQARNQIYIFVAQEVANTRLDVMRQIEARARFAANRQQRRTDVRAALGKAVSAQYPQSQGKDY
jgi:P-type conjugative transfer protein TrbJ